ncbi:MAG: stage III sporulation protein AG [bacterium]|nr:stage III sporulation protein AG [bacterium]
MSGVLRQWVEKKGLEKYFRRDNLVILVLVGILLFVIALPTDGGKEEKDRDGSEGGTLLPSAAGDGGRTAGEETPEQITVSEYAAMLEERLTEALSDMEDVGKVRVMITLKSSEELVVERETSVTSSATAETDAQGGTRTVNTGERNESVVYSTDGTRGEPYVVKSLAPQIEGVLVVAQGAGSGKVNRTVTEIAQALFGVEAHKVKVVRMKEQADF